MSDVEKSEDAEGKPEQERQFPFTLKLKTPVSHGNPTISELVFQQGTLAAGKGLKFKEDVPQEALILIASRLSGQPTNVIEKLSIDDGQEAMDIALGFYVRLLGRTKP